MLSAVRCLGPFRLTGSRVERPVVALVLDKDRVLTFVRLVRSLAVARCDECGHRVRVLPCNVLPFKRYDLNAIAALCHAHVLGNRSLRDAVDTEHPGWTPAHSTLHAWSEGLGAYVSGRAFGEQPGAHPFSSLLAWTRSRWSALPPLPSPVVDPDRARSTPRLERLTAVAGVLVLARAVLAAAAIELAAGSSALMEWRRLALTYGVPSPFSFRTGIACTPSEHRVRRDPESPGSSDFHGDLTCPTRSRSPPGGSARSVPSSIPPSAPPASGP